ncbi:BTAD domain-containing putative transcriptional regulator [Nocardia sp. CDC153]|uniref:BTAD domain-containing putative transcriptional regulator n=1 Tax=Nocardia sp. CDC153 TaxID=3112167 RepID=UPI002DB9AA28|nr:BTAD domain-containing putative transcriptional regulator [Nocardia sp. CDC153]MEC3952631.1 BTAD domain-containing putative transcriptional regulator [Nocardia sp. CDC153]
MGGPRVRTLLALLALEPGRVISCDALICGIWGEARPADPANALQTLVKRVRALLPPEAAVESAAGGYRLRIAADAIDIHRFARLVEEGVGAPAQRAAGALDAALELWRGEPFADLVENADLYWHADRLNQLRLDAVEARADAYLALGRGREVIESLVRELRAEPLRESLAVTLIRAFTATGQAARAREVFDVTRDQLRTELGVAPSPELVAAVEHIGSGTTVVVPALPVRLTSLIGREPDLKRLGEMLSDTRLVTLTGPGGVGKTSLALEAATRAAGRWRGGCRFMELAAVSDAVGAVELIRAELGLSTGPESVHACPIHRPVPADTELLLVLDNCEHVLEIAGLLADLLARCPNLTVLATSREPLGMHGETLFPVAPLAAPAPGAAPAEALGSAAVHLFLDRARSVRPGFTVTGENYETIAAICRRLDGIPLALELAAARIHTLTPAQILTRLDDRFRLLAGNRAAAARHRSLYTAIEWSWESLREPERRMAQRLWLFPEGATLEALEEVCPGDAVGPLSRLVSKSLIEFDGRRYRMLETIHAFVGSTLSSERRVA